MPDVDIIGFSVVGPWDNPWARFYSLDGKEALPLLVKIWMTAVFVAGMTAVVPARSQTSPATVVATVDRKPIMVSDVQREAMEMVGAAALQRLIEFRVIDDEARKDGITVTAADMKEQLRKERAKLTAPATLEDELKQHHLTMPLFEEMMRHNIELHKLLIGRVQTFPLYHLRAIMIYVSRPGATQTGPVHTDAQAEAIVTQAERDLQSGKKWDDIVKQYSEDAPTKGNAGDLGIVNKVSGYDQGFTNTAADLKNGQISTPFKILDGYAVIQRISSGADHPASENDAYDGVESAYEDYMVGHLSPSYVQNLQLKAKIVNYLSP